MPGIQNSSTNIQTSHSYILIHAAMDVTVSLNQIMKPVNKSKLGLVNGAIGIVTPNPKPQIEPDEGLEEE